MYFSLAAFWDDRTWVAVELMVRLSSVRPSSSVADVLQGCARDLLSRDRDEIRDPCLRDRDVQNFVWDETETRRCSFRDAGRDLEARESNGSFNVSSWHMVKHIDNETKLYGLINSNHGKRFLFVILWVFAVYFDNYHWIINGLHHKELQLQCWRHEPLCLSQFASN